MSFDNIWQWSETAASNTAIASTDITGATGKVKDGDNAIRAMMSQIITMEGKGTDVASASTVNLGTERYYHITGTTTIDDIDFTDPVNGRWAWLVFDGVLTLNHNSSNLVLPGGANITTAAGDTMLVVQDNGNNILCLSYQRTAVAPALRTDYGTYTPTLTNVNNLASSSVSAPFTYSRTGDMVTVFGVLDVDPTTTTTQTDLGISLPIASALSSGTQLGGTGACSSGTLVNEVWAITGDGGNDRANCRSLVQTAASHTIVVNFSYRVI